MTRALITWGGWDGHEPDRVAALFAGWLGEAGLEVTLTDSLACFDDLDAVKAFDLIVPVWTMSTIGKDQALNACAAVASGVGIAGCHGGMCDAFRENVDWQFLTGAQWVAHPGNDGVEYGVRIVSDDPVVAGIGNFTVKTEQFYLHVDPAVRVHAVCDFPVADGPHAVNGPVAMPVVFTKGYGAGRVYYNALGHKADVIGTGPAAELMRRGLIWAARRG
ncbi:ThuA domain-containing protein [Tabrizicola sp.]|uniref:ThuA domain-containing protein n=1 Tax=Tabrizicola sp. TaxID=2005166 RepID=UPI0025F53ED4|nr:ThuA domain-containing protein [Tabrizicola sp.]MBY0351309.1 ThuA domain-containing protein [Tabrizicola sp.]